EIVTSNTVFIPPEDQIQKLTVLSVAPIFGEAIRRNYLRKSIEGLFVYGDD
ncbi:MAG TPA: ribose-phosphate pyrophosphokinase, partial [Chloroflexi bacterium]|nr:ribose-phosphate pyrophosphokinase [Chloroflexota bacterium]